MKTPETEVPIMRYLHSEMRYPQIARVISPTAQKPTHPQKVLQLGVTNSRGRTKFTTITPTKMNNSRSSDNSRVFCICIINYYNNGKQINQGKMKERELNISQTKIARKSSW